MNPRTWRGLFWLPAITTLLMLATLTLAAQTAAAPDARFSGKEFIEPIKYLSSDALKGRGDGTPELDKAADYLAGRFRSFGLKPLGDNGTYLQHFTLVTGAKLGSGNVAALRMPNKTIKLKVQEDFVPLSFSANATAEPGLAFVGYGITAPEFKYDDYAGIDVKGKMVIVLRHEPQENDEKSVFSGTRLTSHAEIANKAINAKNHGAAGMILVSDVGNHPGYPDTLAKLGDVNGPTEMSIPVIHVTAAAVDQALAAQGKTLDGLRQQIDAHVSPASFLLDGAKVLLRVNIERVRKQVANVVGELPGADSAAAMQYIVVGAHYDHLGLGEHDSLAPSQRGQIHHGADDNASGTSGVLELADVLSHSAQKPKHSVVFICFAGEELGLLGSSYYSEHPALSNKDAIAMLNMDMIGRVAKNKLYVSGTGTSPGFQQLVQTANQGPAFDIAYSASGYGSSDQTSFTVHDVPVLFFFSGLHSDYHKPSDTWEKIDADAGSKVVELVSNVVSGLDALTVKPQFVRVAEPTSPTGSGGGSGYGAYFGSIPDFGEQAHGVKFSDVRDGSPAAKAGFKAGDVLIDFDGKKIDNLYDMTYALRAHKPGDKVSVTVIRGVEKITRDVTLEVRK